MEIGFDEVGAPDGTTFLVRNLFFNTPVRRKFLKHPATEGGYIADLMEHLALSRPDISFKLILNGQMKFHTSGNGDLREVIYRIYGRDAANALVPVQSEQDGVKIEGYLGKPVQVRSNRNFEIYFINGRFIRSNIIARAVEEGYREYLMQHKFPFCVLHITMDTTRVDVNVHPTKMDVRLTNAPAFSAFLCGAVKYTLKHHEMIPDALLSTEKERQAAAREEQKEREKQKAPEPFEKNRGTAYRVAEEMKYEAERSKMQEFIQNPVWARVKSGEKREEFPESGGEAESFFTETSEISEEVSVKRAAALEEVSTREAASGEEAVLEEVVSKGSPVSEEVASKGFPVLEGAFAREPSVSEAVSSKKPSASETVSIKEPHALETVSIKEPSAAEAVSSKELPALETSEPAGTVARLGGAGSFGTESHQAGEDTREACGAGLKEPGTSLKESHSDSEKHQFDQLNLFEEKILTESNRKRFRIIGQVFETYWLIEFEDKMMMIDQHAAHEKVNYERLMKQFREKTVVSQRLMPPVIVSLSGQEESVFIQNSAVFSSLGFEIESFGGSEYALRSVPVDLYGCNEREMFLEVLDQLAEGVNWGGIRVVEEKIASMSCKAAVKGNSLLSAAEAESLIDELLTLENPYNCPHGRPTIIVMSKAEMDRKFKRIVN